MPPISGAQPPICYAPEFMALIYAMVGHSSLGVDSVGFRVYVMVKGFG